MPPCPFALATSRLRARNWHVRADLLDRIWESKGRLVLGATVASEASIAGLCPRHFRRVFADLAGLRPASYRRKARLELARSEILAGNGIRAAREAAGYQSASTFSREFRKEFGHAPSAPPNSTGDSQRS